MARIKGVDIPNDKHICISLTYIYGIGRKLALQILEEVKIDPTTITKTISQEDLIRIRDVMNNHLTEGDLRREVSMNIKTKMEINSYEGTRHKRGLPLRGQRTSRNARTRKGKAKTVANKKK